MLFLPPNLTDKENQVISRICEMQVRLGLSASTASRKWTGLLRRGFLARAIQGSNSIEGYVVSIDDALALLDDEEPLDATRREIEAIKGYRMAMTYALQVAGSPLFAYSELLLQVLHFMMIQHDPTKRPGMWRLGNIFVNDEQKGVRVYEGPPAEDVPGLMGELIGSLSRSTQSSSLVDGAMAHLNLVMIHPFADGNGRMARCLQSLVLAHTNTLPPPYCSIEEHLGEHTQSYYDVLTAVGRGKWCPEGDAMPWIRFCLRAHYQQLATNLRRTENTKLIWGLVEDEARRRKLPERMITPLVQVALGNRIRNATYRSLNLDECSVQTAVRDLAALVKQKLLVPHGEMRGRYYLCSPQLLEIVEAGVLSLPIEDPFADQ